MRKRYSRAEISTLLKVSKGTPVRWTTTGVRGQILRSYLVGSRRYVDAGDLELFLCGGSADPQDAVGGKAADAAADELSSRWGL